MELINKDTLQIKEFISSLDSMLIGIESIVKHYKPHLNGERFLSNNEVSKKLNVSLRTLQEWREGLDLNRLNTEITFVNASYWVLENLL